MSNQLFIEVERINPDLFELSSAEYERCKKLKDLHPVFHIFNKVKQEYFVGRYFKKETWESMSMYLIVK